VFFSETKRVPRPYGDETLAIIAKRLRHHILNTVRLCGAPNHNIEPSTRPEREEVRAKSSEVRSTHDAAWGRVRVRMVAAMGFGGTWGTEEQGAIEI
jgi:hypothetical protein